MSTDKDQSAAFLGRSVSARLWPFLILLVGLLFRVSAWRTTPPIVNERSSTYLQQATELARDLTLNNPEALRRPPTYSVFLALHLRLFQDGIAAAVFSQHILGLGTIALLMTMTRMIWASPAVVFLVGLLGSADPFLISYESHIESESLFIFLMTATLCLLVRFWQEPLARRKLLPAAGLVSGLAALCRPEFALFPTVASTVFLAYGKPRSLRPWKEALAFSAPHVLLVLLWMIRNSVVLGVFTLSLMGSITSLQTSGPWIDWESPTNMEAKAAYREALEITQGSHVVACNQAIVILMRRHGVPFPDALRKMADLGRDTVRRHPFAYLWATRQNFADFAARIGGASPLRGLLKAGAVIGLVAAWRRRSPAVLLIMLTALYLIVVNCLVEIGKADRRTLELEPLLILLAASALTLRRHQQERYGRIGRRVATPAKLSS